jgi:hypothetical protein
MKKREKREIKRRRIFLGKRSALRDHSKEFYFFVIRTKIETETSAAPLLNRTEPKTTNSKTTKKIL